LESAVTEMSSDLDSANLNLIFGLPEEQSWQERALCAQTDPEAFFPEKGGSTREAKRVCTGCEVRAECLEYALENDERFGIWGGLSERERRRLKRRGDAGPLGDPGFGGPAYGGDAYGTGFDNAAGFDSGEEFGGGAALTG
jgi:WhiB family transcriptional regulator, redox-sensing transcriptional regulator